MNRKIQTKSTIGKFPSSSLAPRRILQKRAGFVQRRGNVPGRAAARGPALPLQRKLWEKPSLLCACGEL